MRCFVGSLLLNVQNKSDLFVANGATGTKLLTMEVKSIQFGILSDADIVGMAVCVVNKSSLVVEHGSVYDPRMGCVQTGDTLGQVCATCNADIWSCSGHFGVIELNTPIILFHKQVVTLLRCVCLSCFRLLNTTKTHKSFAAAVEFLSNLSGCQTCGEPVAEVKYVAGDVSIQCVKRGPNKEKIVSELQPQFIKRVFDTLPDSDARLLCLNLELVHPRNYVLTKFPVIPTCCRPKTLMGDSVTDDDLTLILVDILKSNNYLAQHAPADDLAAYNKAVENIKLKTLAYCDNSKGRATHSTNHKPLTGIKERIGGKNSLMRRDLNGKRCNRTARTVLGPDPTLKLDEVVIPRDIANILTVPEHVTPLNIERLTALVNSGQASTIIKAEGLKINVAHARVIKGTKLAHTDVILRPSVGEIMVSDCRMKLYATDVVRHAGGQCEPVKLSTTRELKLVVGDVVERYVKNGDLVYLNRQPTLHRNGMLGMKAVVCPGKTIRVNLSVTKGYNMDFDGDEGNLYLCESQPSRAELQHVVGVKEHMLSAQSNKPEQCLVQDTLLAAYLMTVALAPLTSEGFMYCLFKTNKYDRFRPAPAYYARDLFCYILPSDFSVSLPTLTIKNGRIESGYFSKASLGSTKSSIIRLLCLEYGKETAADFIDNIQFLSHAWLELNPFSIGMNDCLVTNSESLTEIKQSVQKYFVEASVVRRTVASGQVREAKINIALNKAKDLGLRIATESLDPNNKIKDTVTSGSKGDFFNIAQITGLLGQQNLSNARPVPTLTNKSRTLIHYPHVITNTNQRYESRGFIQSGFLEGLNPKEAMFHAMSGREGMINTAMKTATSGYIQRSCTKLNEDLKVAYDGTVRDARNGIYQFAYGNTGFDPSLVTNTPNGVIPVDVQRLCARLNCHSSIAPQPLKPQQMDNLVDRCRWRRPASVPSEIADSVWVNHERLLRRQLAAAAVAPDKLGEFEAAIVERYHTSLVTPGECVGIIGAQSIGEMQTQSNLNTFHTAGKLQYNGVERFEEILKMTKSLHSPMMCIYFNQRYSTAQELRRSVGSSIVCVRVEDLVNGLPQKLDENVWRIGIKKRVLFSAALTLDAVADAIELDSGLGVDVEIDGPLSITVSIPASIKSTGRTKPHEDTSTFTTAAKKRDAPTLQQILNIQLCGIEGITAMHLDRNEDDEFYVVTEGSNYKKMLCHRLVDVKRLYTNDIWAVYECLGIAATKQYVLRDIKRCISEVNDCHPRLLAEKMTWGGKPAAITRYTMRNNAVGPISKSTFEQCVDVLLTAAHRGETDTLTGVSGALVVGKQVPAGTGYINILMDWKAIIARAATNEDEVTYY